MGLLRLSGTMIKKHYHVVKWCIGCRKWEYIQMSVNINQAHNTVASHPHSTYQVIESGTDLQQLPSPLKENNYGQSNS